MYKSSQFQSTFTEPSYCGAFLSGLFWYIVFSKEKFKLLPLSLLGIAIILNMSSTGLIMFAVGALLYFVKCKPKAKIFVAGTMIIVCILGLCLLKVPAFIMLINKVYNVTLGKFSSHSYIERNAWNIKAIQTFFDTFMLGAGLSSVRASSFLLNLLGTVGIVGTILIGLYMYQLSKSHFSTSNNNYLYLVLVGMIVSIPDLNFPILWLAIFVTIASKRELGLKYMEDAYYEQDEKIIE